MSVSGDACMYVRAKDVICGRLEACVFRCVIGNDVV